MSQIAAAELSKRFGTRIAVDRLSLAVEGGEVVALVGENGAGKTTALGMLSGQIVPDEGQALIAGHDVYQAPIASRSELGFVAQDLLLPPHLTTREMVTFASQVKQRPVDPAALKRLLELTDLTDDADRLLGELSFGMQRKASWVVALVTDPSALLLDEGLAGLDASSRKALTTEVAQRVGRGMAVLWTEHDPDPVVGQLDRVLVLHRGKVAEVVSGDEVRALASARQLEQAMRRWTSF